MRRLLATHVGGEVALRLDAGVDALAHELLDCWQTGRQVFLCGNGGSARQCRAYRQRFPLCGVEDAGLGAARARAAGESAVVTCLANDEGYDKIFSLQLAVLARPGDVLIVLSGSGNSPNILKALEQARRNGMRSYAILGYSGGKAKAMADVPIHFAIDDMQISEDLQMMVAHMIMQWLSRHRDRCERAKPPAHVTTSHGAGRLASVTGQDADGGPSPA